MSRLPWPIKIPVYSPTGTSLTCSTIRARDTLHWYSVLSASLDTPTSMISRNRREESHAKSGTAEISLNLSWLSSNTRKRESQQETLISLNSSRRKRDLIFMLTTDQRSIKNRKQPIYLNLYNFFIQV